MDQINEKGKSEEIGYWKRRGNWLHQTIFTSDHFS